MSLSCGCDDGYDTTTVGDPRECTCRTPRRCSACCRQISVGDLFNIWSMYDFASSRTAAPSYLCEECGDMARNLMVLGFCFSIGPGIREQWLEYLEEIDPNNPAVRRAANV